MDGKPPAALIRQLNTIADVYVALRMAGMSADRARRIVCDMAGARLTAASAPPVKAPYGWRGDRYVILEHEEQDEES